ncbi:GAF domain-containing protein [Rugamonas sp.]|uniref:GAF domain-containing protein n=1 Tax=Rugamonas sp. TaxID=1926287 RepID=UPI0025E38CB5|nr:GAF domain-containing protein [Rugamonas sp.]
MMQFRLSNTAWQIFASALALLGTVYLLLAITNAVEPMSRGEAGGLGAQFKNPFYSASHKLTIEALESNSPLILIGAKVGDKIQTDHAEDEEFLDDGGESVGLTVFQSGVAHHTVIKTAITPILSGKIWKFWVEAALACASLLFGIAIAFKQPELHAYRALALYFIFSALNLTVPIMPVGDIRFAMSFIWYATLPFSSYALFLFSVYYPSDLASGIRAYFVRAKILFQLFTLYWMAICIWFAMGHEVPWFGTMNIIISTSLTLATIIALWDGLRSAHGEYRQKQSWVLMCFGILTVSSIWTYFDISWEFGGWKVILIQLDLITIVCNAGLVYAVLKHRVFNFGFAVNRAIFYSATSLILLIAFGIVEWLSEHLLHFEGREANVLIDGGIALGVYLAFHKIRHFFEHWLERLFFHEWHTNEAKLRLFVRHAAQITTTDALLHGFSEEIKRFTGGAGCTIYMQDAEGDYEQKRKPVASDAVHININDSICLALRSDHVPMLFADDHPLFAHRLALPMSHRGDLQGFALLGAKPDGDEYRPDEIDVLGHAAHQIGLDLHALQIESLKAVVDAYAVKIQSLQYSIDHLHAVVEQVAGKPNQITV